MSRSKQDLDTRNLQNPSYSSYISVSVLNSFLPPLWQPVQRGSRVEGDVGGQPRLRRGAHLQAHDQGPHAGHRPRISGQGEFKQQINTSTKRVKLSGFKISN